MKYTYYPTPFDQIVEMLLSRKISILAYAL